MMSQTLIEQKTALYAAPHIIEQIVRIEKPTIESIISAVCKYCDVTADRLKSKSRKRNIIEAKRMFCLFAHRHYSLERVGLSINLNHATVLYHRNTAWDLLCQKSEAKLLGIANRVSLEVYGIIDLPTRDKYTNEGRLNVDEWVDYIKRKGAN